MIDSDSQRSSPNGRAGAEIDRLSGEQVTLRPVVEADLTELVRIRATPEVVARWRGATDVEAELRFDLDDVEIEQYAITIATAQTASKAQGNSEPGIIGLVQWGSEEDPDYLHASIDIYLDPEYHGRGLGTDAVTVLARHLFGDRGHHRITIDPAADNHVAIRSYTKVGFRPVGVLRRYERGPDGNWHDGLLMELLDTDLD